MSDFTITERKEPFTLDEVFSFIDDTYITKTDAHELKSRIVDVVQAERNKAIDEFAEKLKEKLPMCYFSHFDDYVEAKNRIDEIAEQMKAGDEV